jgi:hypothetical protein
MKYLREHNINPELFLSYRPEVPFITLALPEASIPLDVVLRT